MGTPTKKFLTSRGGKHLWVTGAVLLTIIQLPLLLLYYIPKSCRQHSQWTYLQAIMNELMRKFLYHSAVVEVKTPLNLVSATGKGRFVTIEPSQNVYRGVLEDSAIRPSVTGGLWYPNPYQKDDEERFALLHFHGGSFVIGEGREGDGGYAGRLLSERLGAKALFLSYRLASNEGGRFPAALQDAVTGYQYLLDQGIPPGRIVLSGDSAGGNLAIALLRYIVENPDILPEPYAVLLWSPATNIAAARDPAHTDTNRHSTTDYLCGNQIAWGAKAYTAGPVDPGNPYISPLDSPFHCKTPIWCHSGGLEILHDECMAFVRNMKSIPGNSIQVHTEPYANHDIVYVGNLTGFAAEAEKAVDLAKEFLDGQK